MSDSFSENFDVRFIVPIQFILETGGSPCSRIVLDTDLLLKEI